MGTLQKIILGTTILSTLSLSAGTANAGGEAGDLVQRIEQLERQNARLEAALTKIESYEQQFSNILPSSGSNNNGTFSMKTGPKFTSADGKNTLKIYGRVQADAGWSNDDSADLGEGTEIRRAWLGMKGKTKDVWRYNFLIDFAGDSATVKDAYVGYNGFEMANIKVGQFKEPTSFENLQSSLHLMFMERSPAISVFQPLRNIGAAASFGEKDWGLTVGVFGDDAGDRGGEDEGYSVSGRGHFAAINENGNVLHLGANARVRTPDADADSVRFRARPESRTTRDRVVDTGTIANVDNFVTYGAELYAASGPASLQAQYNMTKVSRGIGSDLDFSGGYVAASYFLTGEQRKYSGSKGVAGRVTPGQAVSDGGNGAWEAAFRYTFLDLTDDNVLGGEMDSYTLGVNWYPESNIKFQANYIILDTDQNAVVPNDSPNLFMLRAQYDF